MWWWMSPTWTKIATSFLVVSIIGISVWFYPYTDLSGRETVDRWWSRWSLLIAFLSIVYAFQISKRLHWTVVLPIVSTLLSCAWIFSWKHNQYLYYFPGHKLGLKYMAAENAATFLLMLTTLTLMTVSNLRKLVFLFGYLGFANSIYILGGFFAGYDSYWRVGFITSNASMDACFIAATYPILIHKTWDDHSPWTLAWAIPPLAAIILTDTSMGLASLGVVIFVMTYRLVTKGDNRPWVKSSLGVLFVALSLSLTFSTWTGLVDSSGRGPIWNQAYIFWKANANYLFGMGQGSTIVFLPFIQKHIGGSGFTDGVFGWLHNDWLQLIFEQGIIGFSAFALCFGAAFKRAANSSFLLPVIFVCGFYASGNWPIHFSLHAFFFLLIVVYCFREDHGKYSSHQNGLLP